MSKFKDVVSLTSALDEWVERRVKSIETRLHEVDERYISEVNKEPEVKELAAAMAEIDSFLKDVMDVDTDDPKHPLEYAKDTIKLMLSEIQEYKELPVEEDVSKEEPTSREATSLELAFVEEVNKLQKEVDVLVAYKAGIPAFKRAQDRAVTLYALLPPRSGDMPDELLAVYDILPLMHTRLKDEIREQSVNYRSIQ
ncbi:hypothetical protein 035JT004_107 [Bacillus phage 035JT004]|nr:hypothetical protein 035JT004_107 [Bacillus phage 035JT004]